nr:phage tail tape measure protein [Microbacterium marinum]
MGAFEAQQSTAELAAELGVAGDEADRLGAVASAVWADGFGEAPEVNSAIGDIRRNLGEMADDDLERVAGKALAVSTVFEEDVARTIGGVSALVKNDLVDSVDEGMDVIAAGLASTANRGEDLLDTFTEYSPFFAKLGFDAQQSLGLMNQGMEAGARNSDFLADALKEFTIRAQEPVVKTAEEMAAAYERVEQAGASLARAQQNEIASQQSLNEARAQAAMDLADMADQLEGAELSTRSAELALQRAQENAAKVAGDSEATQLDRDEAALAVDQAIFALEQQREATEELRREKADADRAGVEGSAQVQAAHERVADAQKASAEAAADVAEANAAAADNTTPLGKAYERLGIDAAWAANAIATGGPEAQRALQMVRDGLLGVTDPVERNALAVQFFGTKAEDLQGALYAMDPSTAVDAMGNVAGAADRVGQAITDGPMKEIEAMSRDKDLMIQGFLDTDGPMGDLARTWAVWGGEISGVLGALGPLAGAMLLFRGAQVAGTAATAANTGAMIANNAAWWASPVTWIIAGILVAIGLLVAAGIWLVENWDGVSAFFGDVWENMMTGAETATDWIGDRLGEIGDWFGSLGDGVTGVMNFIGDGIMGAGHAIATGFAWLWNNTLGAIDISIPDWVPFIGGNHIGFDKIVIPALAAGGVALGPTLALIGEAGPEAVVPLSQAGDYGLGGSGDGEVTHVVLNLDGRTVYEAVERHKRKRR